MKEKKEKMPKDDKVNKKMAKKEKKKEKMLKKENAKKEKKPNKFIEIIKKKWLINGTKTLILILLIIAVFLGINVWVQSLDLTPLDFSQEKLYTLTDESKERVKGIDKDINIYFVGYDEDNADLTLAKQYHNANEKIKVEAVTAETNPELVNKYGIESGSEGIIIECGEKSKVLTENDLVTYDTTTYETISVAEERLTSSILSVVTDNVPQIYFLEGYGKFALNKDMKYLNVYLQNEVMQINALNLLTTGKIPDNCDTLVITTPTADFDEVATNAITDYINKGGNILWLNAAITIEQNLPNVNKILAMYGIDPFSVGIIEETNTDKKVYGYSNLIIPLMGYSNITEDLYSNGIIFKNATKININEEELENQNVTETDILTTSDGAYFRTDFNNQSNSSSDTEENGSFVVGAELEKTIQEANEETGEQAKKSKLIIYGENYFISDYQLEEDMEYPAIQIAYNNKDLVLNSIAELSNREEDVRARKNTGTVTYTATEQQDTIVRAIIFAVPAIIVIIGIIVWQVRRRKK